MLDGLKKKKKSKLKKKLITKNAFNYSDFLNITDLCEWRSN